MKIINVNEDLQNLTFIPEIVKFMPDYDFNEKDFDYIISQWSKEENILIERREAREEWEKKERELQRRREEEDTL
jgi:hypothetical protein